MDFNAASERLLSHEGGYVNDPKDPGGETKYGISRRSYPRVNIVLLTRSDALAIYKRDFWDRINADKINGVVAFQLYDFAVNSGIETAVRHYQKALDVADDGHWGPVSQAASEKMSITDQLFRLIAFRQLFQTKLRNWPDHGRGWAVRNANNLLFAAVDS